MSKIDQLCEVYIERITELERRMKYLDDVRSVDVINIVNLAKDLGIQITSPINSHGVFQEFRTGLLELLRKSDMRICELTANINNIRHELRMLINSSSTFGETIGLYGTPPHQPQYKDPTNRDDSFIWNSITNKVGFTSPTTLSKEGVKP